MKSISIGFLLLIFLVGCQSSQEQVEYQDIEKRLQTQLQLAEDGEEIEIEAGHFKFSRSLILDGRKDIVLRGAGMNKTFLSFKDQTEGAEGIRVSNCNNITIEGLTIQDAKGDALKATQVDGITMRGIKAEWTDGAKSSNGAYGLYPVICKNVLIENCEVTRASDAGIYVGQSENAIIRDSKAYENVAGIESENSSNVDIYNNEAYNNSGGILVFDLPGLTRYGNNVKVYNNKIYDNNHENFAAEGNIVATVPPGSGLILMAASDVQVYNNEFKNNHTWGTMIMSYLLVAELSKATAGEGQGSDSPMDEEKARALQQEADANLAQSLKDFESDTLYNPYCRQIDIYDNSYDKNLSLSAFKSEVGGLFTLLFKGSIPDILFDGIVNPDYVGTDGRIQDEYRICIRNNSGASFANFDAANEFDNVSEDATPYDCAINVAE